MLHTRHFLLGALLVFSSVTGIGLSISLPHPTITTPQAGAVLLSVPQEEFHVRAQVTEGVRAAREKFITEVRSRLRETPSQVVIEDVETPTIEESIQIETVVPPILLPEVVPVVEMPTVVEATTTVSSTSSLPIEEIILE